MKNHKQKKQIRVSIPTLMATKTMKAYLATLPKEEAAALETTLDVARHSGADKRIGYLLSAYHHITSIQTLIQADIEILLDNWNLYLKGIRPALTSVQQCNDKFYRAMGDLFSNDDKAEAEKRDDYYVRDVDSLFKKFMRWEGIPVQWEPGKDQRTAMIKAGEEVKEETLIIENDYEWVKIGTIDTKATERNSFDRFEVFCIGKMMDDETVEMSKKSCRTLSSARTVATKYANNDKGNVYIIYKRVNYWHYIPVEYKLNDNK